MKYQYLNISKGEDSYIVSSEFYKFRIEFSYDEDGTLLLHSYYGNGISLDMLDEFEQFVMEKFAEDFDDVAAIRKEHLEILNESPEKFFSTFYINGYVAQQEVLENTVPEEFRKQITEFYKVEYTFVTPFVEECLSYPFCRIRAIQEEYADILSIPSSCGILIFDVEHIYGIIEFEGFRRAFADVWNRQRGPQVPKLYPTDLNSMYLVKKFTANDAGKITESQWDYFFSNFPSTVTRTYNEFMNK